MTPVALRLGRSALHVGHHHQTVGEQPAVRSRDRHRHGQTFTIKVLEELGLPREISVAPGTQTTDREVPVDAHAPHVVGAAASERLDASDVVTPLLECIPSLRQHLRRVPNIARGTFDRGPPIGNGGRGPAHISWCSEPERASRLVVQRRLDLGDDLAVEEIEVGRARELLTQQPVCVLVAPALPRAVRVATLSCHRGSDGVAFAG